MSSTGTEEIATLHTNMGDIVLRFFPTKAPKHVENFKKLATEGFYNGTKFHRVIPGFMIQGGDPLSKMADRSRHGTGGPGHTVPAEFNDTKHVRGVLSAARSNDPNSAGSQFFIVVSPAPHLDGQYTAYGEVVEGLDVVDKIVKLRRDSRDNPVPESPAVIETIEFGSRPTEA